MDPGGGPEGALLVVSCQHNVAALSHKEDLFYHQLGNAKLLQIHTYRQTPKVVLVFTLLTYHTSFQCPHRCHRLDPDTSEQNKREHFSSYTEVVFLPIPREINTI